jgi:hypothetical protein
MLARCHTPTADCYALYGGRGITVCPEWHDFRVFYEEWGRFRPPGLSIDRIDNNRGYELGNVRWANQAVQTSNMRRNVLVRMQGEVVHLSEAARRVGLDPSWFRKKLYAGKIPDVELLGRRG